MIIAFQGRRGAYSESAAYYLFGCDIQVLPLDDFESVYLAVQNGQAHGGVIPIENSTAGSVHENYDLLLKYRLPIVGEIKLQIEHALVARAGTKIQDLREVLSHPQALAQCSDFFLHNPTIKRVPSFDTAGSAELIAAENTGARGAIASLWAARCYGLAVLRHPLENLPGTNYTRFFGICPQAPAIDPVLHTKTSVVFAPERNESGVLYKALGLFASRHINLTRIESRPRLGSPWDYVFYLDLEGNPKQTPVAQALEELKLSCAFVHHLGSYPAGEQKALHFQENSHD